MRSHFLFSLLVVHLLTVQVLAMDVNVAVVHIGAVDEFSAVDYPEYLEDYGIQNAIDFLVDDGRFGTEVPDIDVDQEGVPDLNELAPYDAIMVVTDAWGPNSPEPPEDFTGGGLGTQLGNVLDDYVLDGGRVVFTAFCGDVNHGIDGDILDLAPYVPQGVNVNEPSCLDMDDANLAHPVYENVSCFCPLFSSEINLHAPTGERLGRFLNGEECVLTTASDSVVGADAIMFINGYPGTLDDINNVECPDFEVLFANALALSKVPSTNQIPYANAGPDQTVYAWIDGIAEVTLDGSDSNDPDGDELSFLWFWTVDSNTYEANGVNPVIELPVGEHTIGLIVNDGLEDSEPDYVDVTVIKPLKSCMCICPWIINRICHPRGIVAFMYLPEGVTKEQISDERLMLYPGGIESKYQLYLYSCRGRIKAIALFDMNELLDAVPYDGIVELDVVGQLDSGQYFYGSRCVWIISSYYRRW